MRSSSSCTQVALQTGADDCTAIGSGTEPFGDLDCDNAVTANDGVADLRMIAGVPLDFLAACQ